MDNRPTGENGATIPKFPSGAAVLTVDAQIEPMPKDDPLALLVWAQKYILHEPPDED